MKKSVLVIEDDEFIRESIQELLVDEGIAVSCCTNGQEALDFLQAAKELPHVILLDLMMPVMDGYTFVSEKNRQPRIAGVPVVVMTADGQIQSKTARVGANEYLRKPLEIDHLISVVERYLPKG